mgnify:CR=1 FL=1
MEETKRKFRKSGGGERERDMGFKNMEERKPSSVVNESTHEVLIMLCRCYTYV